MTPEDVEPGAAGWHCDWCAEVYPKAIEALGRLLDATPMYGNAESPS